MKKKKRKKERKKEKVTTKEGGKRRERVKRKARRLDSRLPSFYFPNFLENLGSSILTGWGVLTGGDPLLSSATLVGMCPWLVPASVETNLGTLLAVVSCWIPDSPPPPVATPASITSPPRSPALTASPPVPERRRPHPVLFTFILFQTTVRLGGWCTPPKTTANPPAFPRTPLCPSDFTPVNAATRHCLR